MVHLFTLGPKANHDPIYIWKRPFAYWSVVGQVVSWGVVKDACDVRMGLQMSTAVVLSMFTYKHCVGYYILTSFKTVWCQWKCLSRKLNHVPKSQKDFCMAWQLLLSLSLPFILQYPTISAFFPDWGMSCRKKTWWFTAWSYRSQLSVSHQ